jgi:hypothetical protein
MAAHNYFLHEDRVLSFRWGSIHEDYYAVGEKISWSFRNRPDVADKNIFIAAYDDSVRSLDDGYYLIEISNDVFLGAHSVSRGEFETAKSAFAI